ncbi:YetF domain-containing protein [Streptomyces sp. NPDC051219]
MVQLRLHGIEDISDVRCAYLEPNGRVSVLRRAGRETNEPPDRPEVL